MGDSRTADLFGRFAKWSARASGHPTAFAIALFTVGAWLITGPIFHWSDAWQLVINTWTNIATFLMVFLIQNSQNRDSQAMQIKLDEVIRSIHGAHNSMIGLEERSDTELDTFRERYLQLAEEARQKLLERRRRRGEPADSKDVAQGSPPLRPTRRVEPGPERRPDRAAPRP